MIYKVVIDKRLPSLNEYTKACRTNKFIGAKMKEDIETNIWADIKMQLKNKKIEKPVKIHFTWIEENRKRDLDNICFAKKFILDALVKAHTLKNDTRKLCSWFFRFFCI